MYFDCFSGASGDMLLGGLLDAGAPLEEVRAGLATLPVAGWALEVEQARRQGLLGTHARVIVGEQTAQPRRGLAEVEAVVRGGGLPAPVTEHACAVFRRLAEAEARVHGTGLEEVHFHEVGAVDAIVDVVGVVLALHLLGVGPPHAYSSGLPMGSGWVESEHGPLPAPAPATAELLRAARAPTRPAPRAEVSGELTTPTGAALLTTLARFEEPAFREVEHIGYGLGTRALPWPNVLRVWVGAPATPDALLRDTVVQIETHLDDSTPEQLGFAMERLLEAGAVDVAFGPLQMKKNRPGVLVRVLAQPPQARQLTELLLAHTSALGARVQTIERLVAPRSERTVRTPWGAVRVKEKRLGERVIVAPEYEDCAALARAAGLPLVVVYDAARVALDQLP